MTRSSNINSLEYWDVRFGSGDWERKGGFSQTRAFAEAQVPRLGLGRNFSRTLCDFGCGAGDAFPVYREAFPTAKLVGVDFSSEAIRICQKHYFTLGQFIVGGVEAVPRCDVIIASNVLEHIEDDELVVHALALRCSRLFLIVPYRERPLTSEHLRSYDEQSFARFPVLRRTVYASRGWSEYGWSRYVSINALNVARWFLNRPMRRRNMQVMYEIQGSSPY